MRGRSVRPALMRRFMRWTKYQQGSLRLRHRANRAQVWELRYYQTNDGKRVRKSLILGSVAEFPSLTAARLRAQGLLAKANFRFPRPFETTMETLAHRFIHEEHLHEIVKGQISSDGPTLRYSTAYQYLGMLRKHIIPKWGAMPIASIHPSLVQDWLLEMTAAPKTKGHIKALLHRLYEKAMLWDLIDIQRNPMALVEIRGSSKRIKHPTVLTLTQFNKIKARLPNCFRTMVIVAQCLGLRVSEVLGLQWRDVDFENLSVRVTRAIVNGRVDDLKTEYSHDELPLDEEVARILRNWMRHCPPSPKSWLFPNPITLKPYYATDIQKRHLRRIGEQLGIDNLGWHTFRHTYRSWLDATGASVGVQQKLMRHAQVSTTMNVYGNALMDVKRQANSKVVQMALASE